MKKGNGPPQGFLHSHPAMESEHDLYEAHAHVIVDLHEWKKIRLELYKLRKSNHISLESYVKENAINEFNRGYSCAVANLINLHGVSTESMETFTQNFSSIDDVKKCGASDFDIEEISKLFKDN